MAEFQTSNIIDEWNQQYGGRSKDILFIARLRAGGFSDEQVTKILIILDTICLHCWDKNEPCSCWNDE